MAFDDAFDAVVRQPLRALGLTKRQVQDLTRKGQVAASEEQLAVLASSFCYMRAHADLLVRAFAQFADQTIFDRPLVVVDTGCGLGTGPIALVEHLRAIGGSGAIRIYRGVDHNSYAVALCRKMLTYPGLITAGTELSVDTVTESLDLKERLKPDDRVIFLYSYFFRQEDVTEAIAQQCADAVTATVELVNEPVAICCVDATNGPPDRYWPFRNRLGTANRFRSETQLVLNHVSRYPNELVEPLNFDDRYHPPNNNAVYRCLEVES